MNLILDFWVDNPALFLVSLGGIFLIIEIISPVGFFIPFGIAAFILAIASLTGLLSQNLLVVGLMLTALGVALILPARNLIRYFFDKNAPDINKY